jgi:tungstate transport system permease protein
VGEISEAILTAIRLIFGGDHELMAIVLLSLQVSATAVALAALIGFPLGAAVALFRFPGRRLLALLLNAFMGLPPVVVGLLVYLMLSRAGPLGDAGLLFTPTAMVIAQTLLATPIIAALTRQSVGDLHRGYDEQLRSFGVTPMQTLRTLLWEARFSLITALLAGFGRTSAEVGAVIIVGGNINHVTRVMTTTIALETSKGNLAMALGLGFVLIALVVAVNFAAMGLQRFAHRVQG